MCYKCCYLDITVHLVLVAFLCSMELSAPCPWLWVDFQFLHQPQVHVPSDDNHERNPKMHIQPSTRKQFDDERYFMWSENWAWNCIPFTCLFKKVDVYIWNVITYCIYVYMKLKGILCLSHYYKLSMKNIAQLLSVLNVFTILGLVLFYNNTQVPSGQP